MKVTNLTSPRTNEKVANQFRITNKHSDQTAFQSYESMIVIVDYRKAKITIDPYFYNYSKTTAKYFNQFFNESPVVLDAQTVRKHIVKNKLKSFTSHNGFKVVFKSLN